MLGCTGACLQGLARESAVGVYLGATHVIPTGGRDTPVPQSPSGSAQPPRWGRPGGSPWASILSDTHEEGEEPDSQFVNLTPRLIPPRSSAGEMGGAEYRFTDWSAPLSATRYWLEDVDTMGNVTRHGPVEVPPARVRPIPLPIPPGPAPDFAQEAWQ